HSSHDGHRTLPPAAWSLKSPARPVRQEATSEIVKSHGWQLVEKACFLTCRKRRMPRSCSVQGRGVMLSGLSDHSLTFSAVLRGGCSMRTAMGIALILALAAPAFADDSDDTLRFFLSKSDLVVVGAITSQPFGTVTEVGVVHYICDFGITQVLKGKK